MPFVQGKCENCGGILTVDSSLKAAICPFCGAAYVVQDSINYYNTSIKVENMHADVVNITDESSSEARLKAGQAYIKIGKYDLAENEFKNVTKIAPQNHLGWLGLIEARTHNYAKRIKSASELNKLNDYSLSVLKLAPYGTGDGLIVKWKIYLKSEEEKNDSEKDEISKELSECNEKLNGLVDESESIADKIEKEEKRLYFLIRNYHVDEKESVSWSAGCLGFGILLASVGLILFNWWGLKDDPGLPTIRLVTICLLFVGGGFITSGIIGNNRLDAYKNEARLLREQLEKNRAVSARVLEDIKAIQQDKLLIQKRHNEYC